MKSKDISSKKVKKLAPKKTDGYVVPMSKQKKSEWESAVKQGKDIASGKVTPPYLKGKK